MSLDTKRINSVLDTAALAGKIIVVIGVGGGSFLARQLARCGVLHFRLVDPQVIDPENICRQVYSQHDVGSLKVDVTGDALQVINSDINVETFSLDVTKLTQDQEKAIFAGADLVLALTDNHEAQSTANRVARKHKSALVAVGIYPRGVGGEVFWMRNNDPICYQCMMHDRYANHAKAVADGRNLDPPSEGAPIFAGSTIDSIAGNVILGLLTEGADNMYGRFTEWLANRQLLVTKFDPSWETRPGRDMVREELGIDAANPFYFAYNTVAYAPPESAWEYKCPDCEMYFGLTR